MLHEPGAPAAKCTPLSLTRLEATHMLSNPSVFMSLDNFVTGQVRHSGSDEHVDQPCFSNTNVTGTSSPSTFDTQPAHPPSAALKKLRSRGHILSAQDGQRVLFVVSIPMTIEHGFFCITNTLCPATFCLVWGCIHPFQATTKHKCLHRAGLERPA